MTTVSPSVVRSSAVTLLDDLPFYFAGLDLAFRSLLERLRMETGFRPEFRPGMGSIFFALCEQDDCIIKELVARLKIPNSTISSLLDAMQRQGPLVDCSRDAPEPAASAADGKLMRCGSDRAKAGATLFKLALPGGVRMVAIEPAPGGSRIQLVRLLVRGD